MCIRDREQEAQQRASKHKLDENMQAEEATKQRAALEVTIQELLAENKNLKHTLKAAQDAAGGMSTQVDDQQKALDEARAKHAAEMIAVKEVMAQTLEDSMRQAAAKHLSLIHISEPTRLLSISYAVFCLKKKTKSASKMSYESSTNRIHIKNIIIHLK
eukprot:TRINITY_DN65664_c0_g1_i1.p1 TRINITY_DN65664_c0_g1~~TRINITY_DN65664_c0_g1_i1.p1  ORF type:complete len:159 (-),score=45.63 TRINITY_DN65664_c0_g1_i1:31-507(-)